ncbi:MAG: PRC-barrel domain-containing protein, partial [Acidobacteria bacterium]|nr:PRC-barrel domain-containing protein [Acidobacteriota bacterium]
MTICTHDNEKLGAIGGVLLEPASRRVRYFVVEEPRALRSRRRYLLAADTPAVLDATDCKLRVDASAGDLKRFDSRSVRTASDEDLVTAMFATPAA